jgi:hypothetical protein
VSWLGDCKINVPGLQSKIHTAFSLGTVILLIGAGLWGARQRLKDVQPSQYALVTRPDILAARWIEENIAPEARLLVNSFPAFSNSVIVGSDGGWWLPLLSQQQTTLPPISYAFEQDPWPDYLNQINALTFEIQANGIQNSAVLSQLKERGITYVYVGQLQGMVNSGGPLFTVEQLLTCPSFRIVYHQDRVWIFQIQQVP